MKTIKAPPLDKKEFNILERIKNTVKEIVPGGILIFFGSRVRTETESESDWDILILTETISSQLEHKIHATLYEIELDEDIIINPLILLKEEWEKGKFRHHPIHERIENEGVRL